MTSTGDNRVIPSRDVFSASDPIEPQAGSSALAEKFYLGAIPDAPAAIFGDRVALNKKLHTELSDAALRLLFGGIQGSQTQIKTAGANIDVWVAHSWFETPSYFSLERDESGVILTINDFFLIEKAPQMLGTRIIANMLLEAARIPGFYSIQASATRWYSPEYSGPMREVNGYYFFPRLGFNADPKNADDYIEIPNEIKGKKLVDIMRDPDLRQWWKENGQTIDVEFKLGSKKSNRALLAYLTEKGIHPELPAGA